VPEGGRGGSGKSRKEEEKEDFFEGKEKENASHRRGSSSWTCEGHPRAF
jgi:hypothetical protein